MTLGPVELLVVSFPTERRSGVALDAIGEMVTRGDVTILDLLIIQRGADGDTEVVEFEQAPHLFGLNDTSLQVGTLTSADDIATIAENLPDGRSAAIVVYEHTWVGRVAAAIGDAEGEVELHVRIPPEDAHAALQSAASDRSTSPI